MKTTVVLSLSLLLTATAVGALYLPQTLDTEICSLMTDKECAKRDKAFQEAAIRSRSAVESSGTLKVLVIPIQWSDHPSSRILPTREELEEVWNGVGVSDIIPSGSVANYTWVNSDEKLQIEATVVDWLVTDNTEIYYADGRSGLPNGNSYDVQMEEALDVVLDQLDDMGFDFLQFDQDGDGYIDVVSFLHSGYSAELGGVDCFTNRGEDDRVRSYASFGTSSTFRTIDGINLGRYTMASAFRGLCGSNIARLGVITHEFLHTFGLPDLYDRSGQYLGRSSVGGLGRYDIMANPFGQGNRLAWPGHLSAWSRYQLGWLTPTEITQDGTYSLRPLELYPEAYIISEPYPEGEYLLIEVRRPLLFDTNLWEDGGILIYHVDETIPGSGNWERGFPGQVGWPGNGLHYKVALLQRDGLYELEQAVNGGHIDDFWLSGLGLSLGPGNGEQEANTATYPNTDSYSYVEGVSVTGLTITNFVDVGIADWGATFDVVGLNSGSTAEPTSAPVVPPTNVPTNRPTTAPTKSPTSSPTRLPTSLPTVGPTTQLTTAPPTSQTATPTKTPTVTPTVTPTASSTSSPTIRNTTTKPTEGPTSTPSVPSPGSPTAEPTAVVLLEETLKPTGAASEHPSEGPHSASPSSQPTTSSAPSMTPVPTVSPTNSSSFEPTIALEDDSFGNETLNNTADGDDSSGPSWKGGTLSSLIFAVFSASMVVLAL